VKASAIWQSLGEAVKAAAGWDVIIKQYPPTLAEVAVARLMTGALGPDDFVQWLAENPRALGPGEGDFFLALRAMATGRDRTALELFRVAATEGKGGWFQTIAQAGLRKPPSLRPGEAPSDK
jgi:hypothetical protein